MRIVFMGIVGIWGGLLPSLMGQNAVVRNGGNATVYDLGAQVVNVKAYGAVGNGSTDDTAAINLARAAAQANRQKLFFPGGTYCVGAGGVGITFGDGNPNTNTLPSIQIEGAGHGYYTEYDATPRNPTPTVIKWCGSNPVSTQYIFFFSGPQAGGALRNLALDMAGNSNVIALGVYQTAYFDATDVTLLRAAGIALDANSPVAAEFGNCNLTLRNVNIQKPQTGARGALLTGGASTDSCSWTVIGGDWWHDGDTASTSSLEMKGADNNIFIRTNFYSTNPGNGNSTRCGIKFSQWSTDDNYPQENTFISVSAHDGVCGSYGDAGSANTFIDYHFGDCTTNCDPNAIATGVRPIIQGGAGSNRNFAGIGAVLQIQPTDSSYPTYQNYWNRGYDVLGTELWSAKRGGESGNGMQYGGFAEYLWANSGDMIHRREGTNGQFYGKVYSSTSSNRYGWIFERNGGTVASPTAIGNGYVLGAIAASGRNSGGSQSFYHRINMVAETDGSGNPTGANMRFATHDGSNLTDKWYITTTGVWQAQVDNARVQDRPVAFSSLPTCNSGNDGLQAYISDSNTATFNATAAGGGANRVRVFCNATNWVVY